MHADTQGSLAVSHRAASCASASRKSWRRFAVTQLDAHPGQLCSPLQSQLPSLQGLQVRMSQQEIVPTCNG